MATASTLLWLADAGGVDQASLAAMSAMLGLDEQARCARFVRLERRRQFILGRVLARQMVGRLAGVKPDQVKLTERPGQGPGIAAPLTPPLYFSISHSGAWVACAASLDGLVGLDIERVDAARDVLALAQQAFTPAQVALVQGAPPEQQLATFYRLWCEMEACYKLGQPALDLQAFAWPGLQGVLVSASALAEPIAPSLVQLGAPV